MTPAGLQRLKLDEGLSLTAYPDPKTGKAPWTIGYGCTGATILEGTTWSQAQADGAIIGRTSVISTQLGRQIVGWSGLNLVQQDVLINIAYNIGMTGLSKWLKTLTYIANKNYKLAAQEIRDNKLWRQEVGGRVDRCADAFETGSW